MTTTSPQSVGELLRGWRQRRRMSQLDLALDAELSSKHLSFVETGRARPSRELLLRLADQLAIPPREQNILLLAGGYAPLFPEHSLDAPELEGVRNAVELVLRGHEPYPALAVNRHWTLVASNRAVPILLAGIAPTLLIEPINVFRLGLHPDGLAARVLNYAAWRSHLLARLRQQIEISADTVLIELLQEVSSYPAPACASKYQPVTSEHKTLAVVPLQLRSDVGILSFISTITVFGTPVDITVAELAIESFFPADSATAECMWQLMQQPEKRA